jgi:ferredoxin
MPKMTFVKAEVTVEFASSIPLLEMEAHIMFGCKSGNCGTCVVRVLSGERNLSSRTEKENRLFALLGDEDPSRRLACQCHVHGDVVLLEIN